MNKKIIREKLEKIVLNIGEFKTEIKEDKNFFSERIFDSMQAIDYMISIDEEFGIDMNMEIIEKYKLGKISDLIEYIYNIKKN